MTKAICCGVLLALTSLAGITAQAQTNCSYFSNPNNCVTPATANADSSVKSNAQKSTDAQQPLVPQPSIFTQQNSTVDQSWNTQQKLYAPQNVNTQQSTTQQQKNGTQQNGVSQSAGSSQPSITARPAQNTLLTTNEKGLPVVPGMVISPTGNNNGILKSSSQNLTSTNPNSLAGGGVGGLSNGSVINPASQSSNSLSSSLTAKTHRSYDDDQPAMPGSRSVPRATASKFTNSSTSKSKQSDDYKPKSPSNCIFVGMQQVCG